MSRTASRLHDTSSRAGRYRRTASTSSPHDVGRSQPARSSSSLIRLRSGLVVPEHNHAHPAALTARPPWLAVPRAGGSRPSGSRRPVDPPPSLSVSPRAQASPSVLVVIASRSVTRSASTFGTRSRDAEELAVPCFSAPAASRFAPSDQHTREAAPRPLPPCVGGHGFPQPAPFPFGRPNPGVQWTRCARH